LFKNRLRLLERNPDELGFFIEEELYLQKKNVKSKGKGVISSSYAYKLELIKDIEMINENNFRRSGDEYC